MFLERRDQMCNKFKRHMVMLTERKYADIEHARGGCLDMARLYRHTHDDNIFTTKIEAQKGDSTIIFLMDASSSMKGSIGVPPLPGQDERARYQLRRFDYCNIIVSAFTKAVREVLGDNIRIEIMSKNDFDDVVKDGTSCSGVSLSRTYSSTSPKSAKHSGVDGILKVLPLNAQGKSSSTPELIVLPGLQRWISENIMSKNIMVVNLTDGQPLGSVNGPNYSLGASVGTNAAMYKKYGKWMNIITIFMQGQSFNRVDDETMQKMYGDDVLNVDFSEFPHQLLNSLSKYISASI